MEVKLQLNLQRSRESGEGALTRFSHALRVQGKQFDETLFWSEL